MQYKYKPTTIQIFDAILKEDSIIVESQRSPMRTNNKPLMVIHSKDGQDSPTGAIILDSKGVDRLYDWIVQWRVIND